MIYLHAFAFIISLIGIILGIKNIWDCRGEVKDEDKWKKEYAIALITKIIGFSLYFIYFILSGSIIMTIISIIAVLTDVFLLFFTGAYRLK